MYVNNGTGSDYRKIPYTRVNRPIWPMDEKTSPGLLA
ncbi:hypothetical protein SAMN05216525_1564 [Bradyrhizobium sp. Gha]|nr:hypothetical protein SAMN05216525_1564 [Bradyrhizobium sp. Gha]